MSTPARLCPGTQPLYWVMPQKAEEWGARTLLPAGEPQNLPPPPRVSGNHMKSLHFHPSRPLGGSVGSSTQEGISGALKRPPAQREGGSPGSGVTVGVVGNRILSNLAIMTQSPSAPAGVVPEEGS